MKWNVHNEYIDSIPKKKLNKEIEKNGLTHFILDRIINNDKNNDTITFLTDNKTFLEKTVKKIIGLCYSKNIKLHMIIDEHECLYQSDSIDDNYNNWHFTVSKVSFDSDSKSTICYYFNFIKNHNDDDKNFHLTLMLDEDMS